MHAEAVLVIGGVVGTLCKVAKGAGFSARLYLPIALLMDTLCCIVWVYSHGGFQRGDTWDYLAGWAAVLWTAFATMRGLEEANDQALNLKQVGVDVLASVKGTGKG